MTVQILSISLLCIVLYFPFLVVSICIMFNLSCDLFRAVKRATAFAFITYFIFPNFLLFVLCHCLIYETKCATSYIFLHQQDILVQKVGCGQMGRSDNICFNSHNHPPYHPLHPPLTHSHTDTLHLSIYSHSHSTSSTQ